MDESQNIYEKLSMECENYVIKKGFKCIEQLMKNIDSILPSKALEHGLYREVTTNRCESYFGHLKRKIQHKKLYLYELADIIKQNALIKMNNRYSIGLDKKIIDSRFNNCITEYGKLILSEQYMLLITNQFNKE